jgi:malonyl-CoA/methylmalonyl-CoA synthetase
MTAHFLEALDAAFHQHAARTALVYRGQSWTYAQLQRVIHAAAAEFQQRGVCPGDCVALCTTKKWSLLVAHLGVLHAGAVSLPLNPKFTPDELAYFLNDSQARFVVAGTAQRATIGDLESRLPQRVAWIDAAEDFLQPQRAAGSTAGRWRSVHPSASDAMFMLYSSGTTGRPKGVVHTHANVASSLAALGETWRITPEDVILDVLPLFHIHGLSFAAHMSLLHGSTLHLEDAFAPGPILRMLQRCTVLMAVPTMYYAFLEMPDFDEAARGCRKVRLWTCGSAPIRPEVLPRLEQALGRPIINRYGMTEAHVITSLPLDGPWPPGSVGWPLRGIELQVVRDDGTPAAVGQVGQVRIRGPNLFREYWRLPDRTAQAWIDGWFDTGDLGMLDAQGMLTLTGRKHDLIITSGYNVYPQVVERAINACPGVAESAVFGVPDARRGERVAAAVVRSDPALDAARLQTHLAGCLVDYQRPAEVYFVDSLPRNSLGKVQRQVLRQQIEAERGARE